MLGPTFGRPGRRNDPRGNTSRRNRDGLCSPRIVPALARIARPTSAPSVPSVAFVPPFLESVTSSRIRYLF